MIKSDNSFGKAVLSSIDQSILIFQKVLENLPEKEIADFYIWLNINFPEQEIEIENVFDEQVTISHWKNQLIINIQKRRTSESCNQLRRICNKFPQEKWIKKILYDTEKLTCQKNWEPMNLIYIKSLDNLSLSPLNRLLKKFNDSEWNKLIGWKATVIGFILSVIGLYITLHGNSSP